MSSKTMVSNMVAQRVKNPPAMQNTLVQFWSRDDPWKRDRLPTSVFLGFPGGSAGKESAHNAGDPDSIPGSGRSPAEGTDNPLQVFLPGESAWIEEPGRLQSRASQRVGHN